jgi:hypothetical protein
MPRFKGRTDRIQATEAALHNLGINWAPTFPELMNPYLHGTPMPAFMGISHTMPTNTGLIAGSPPDYAIAYHGLMNPVPIVSEPHTKHYTSFKSPKSHDYSEILKISEENLTDFERASIKSIVPKNKEQEVAKNNMIRTEELAKKYYAKGDKYWGSFLDLSIQAQLDQEFNVKPNKLTLLSNIHDIKNEHRTHLFQGLSQTQREHINKSGSDYLIKLALRGDEFDKIGDIPRAYYNYRQAIEGLKTNPMYHVLANDSESRDAYFLDNLIVHYYDRIMGYVFKDIDPITSIKYYGIEQSRLRSNDAITKSYEKSTLLPTSEYETYNPYISSMTSSLSLPSYPCMQRYSFFNPSLHAHTFARPKISIVDPKTKTETHALNATAFPYYLKYDHGRLVSSSGSPTNVGTLIANGSISYAIGKDAVSKNISEFNTFIMGTIKILVHNSLSVLKLIICDSESYFFIGFSNPIYDSEYSLIKGVANFVIESDIDISYAQGINPEPSLCIIRYSS